MRDAHFIQVDFSDGDSLRTTIYGTVSEIMANYRGVFADRNEKSRTVKLVTFL
jgi:hypothetical protein